MPFCPPQVSRRHLGMRRSGGARWLAVMSKKAFGSLIAPTDYLPRKMPRKVEC